MYGNGKSGKSLKSISTIYIAVFLPVNFRGARNPQLSSFAWHPHPAPFRSISPQINSLCCEGKLKQQAWQTVYHPDWAYTVLEKKEPYQAAVDKTHTPLRLVWGDLHRLHSLVCQGGNIEKVEYQGRRELYYFTI